jgi:hypothetical protein
MGSSDGNAEPITRDDLTSETGRDITVCVDLAPLDADSRGQRSAQDDVV